MDFLMSEAFQIYEDEIAKSSGQPVWISRSTDPNIAQMIEERIDTADAALADWDEAQSKAKGKKKVKGLTRFAVPYDAVAGKPLVFGGLEREKFYAEVRQEAKDQAETFEGVPPAADDDPDVFDPSHPSYAL